MRKKWEADSLKVSNLSGDPSFYDPRQKRSEFFRLQRGDTAGLIAFLNSVGFLESVFSWKKAK